MKKPQKMFVAMMAMYFDSPEDFEGDDDEIVFAVHIRIAKVSDSQDHYKTAEAVIVAPAYSKRMMIKLHEDICEIVDFSFVFTRSEFIQLVHHIIVAHNSYSGTKNRFHEVHSFTDVKVLLLEVFKRMNEGHAHLCMYPFGDGVGACFLISLDRKIGKNGEQFVQLYLNQGGRLYRGSLHPHSDVKKWFKRNGFIK